MIAEIIAIGDELTSGQRLDTNSQWLSQRLGELGVDVLYHSTVGDDLEANVRVFRAAAERAQLILCTGGLGPTADDLTRQALASAAGVALSRDDDALRHIQQLFASRNRPMPPQNEVQALFPAGSHTIPNPHGTAPGIDFRWPEQAGPACSTRARVFALPGVPAEMKEMWEQTVAPAILAERGDGPGRVIRHRVLKCFGVGESDLEQMLPDLIRRGRTPTVGITVHKATISLRITAAGADEQACRDLIDPVEQTIRDCLGKLVFGGESDELQDSLITLLKAAGRTLWVLEYGTGGLLCNWLSLADPDGEVFQGGEVDRRLTDDTEQLTRRLKLAVDEGRADIALGVGPFLARPAATGGPSEAAEPGRVLLSLAGEELAESRRVLFAGHPDILRERCAKQALDLLRLALLKS